ncbi:MAG: sulfatase-like hydrolase/transferase [Pseudomonadota bacterium]
MAQRPNIVFAFADDWGRYASAYAKYQPTGNLNELINTPNFDWVADEGALFLNALVPAPSCTPCRSSILSGQYFWQTGLGAILMGAVWDESIPTFPLSLEAAGYFIGHTYKVWSPGMTMNAPMGGRRTAYNPAGFNFNQFSHWVTEQAPTFGPGQSGIDLAKAALYDETRQNVRAFLDSVPDQQPFCYWWGPTNTHRTWERGSGKALWDIDPDRLKGRLPEFLPDVHDVREDAADYLGECLATDMGLGILIEELQSAGRLDNSLLVVSGDHGIPGMPRAKCNLYDIGCEVALAMRWPDKIKPGRVVDDFVNLMDLGPTFCEAGGITPPESMTARSLLPIITRASSGQIDTARTHVVTGRERHIAHARSGMLPYPQRSLRTRDYIYVINFEPDRWPMGDPIGLEDSDRPEPSIDALTNDTFVTLRDMDASPTKAWLVTHREDHDVEPLYQLAFGKRPREELYDLKADPSYMNNVAEHADYQVIRQELETQLLGILEQENDPRLMEQPCRYEYEPYAGKVDRVWFEAAAEEQALYNPSR